ncbi:MAG: hypothetical protein BGO13_10920 [Burkholderiales bacterium 66-5]|nr:MAG: hypothetical protein BGO13_10920 [Burkholderiales bacterium 66-5]
MVAVRGMAVAAKLVTRGLVVTVIMAILAVLAVLAVLVGLVTLVILVTLALVNRVLVLVAAALVEIKPAGLIPTVIRVGEMTLIMVICQVLSLRLVLHLMSDQVNVLLARLNVMTSATAPCLNHLITMVNAKLVTSR